MIGDVSHITHEIYIFAHCIKTKSIHTIDLPKFEILNIMSIF